MRIKEYLTQRNIMYGGIAVFLIIGVTIFLNGGDFPGLDITLNQNERVYTLAWPNVGIAVIAPEDTPISKGKYLNDEEYFLLSQSDDRYFVHHSIGTNVNPMLRFEFNVSSLAGTYKDAETSPVLSIDKVYVRVEGYGNIETTNSLKLKVWHDLNQTWYEPQGTYDNTFHTKTEDRYLYFTLDQEGVISHMTESGVIRCVVIGPVDKSEDFASKIVIDNVYMKITYKSETPAPPVCNYNGICEANYEETILNCGDCVATCTPACGTGYRCDNGVCVQVTPTPDPTDPCAGVVCGDICEGYNLIARVCSEGQCIKASTKEANSQSCGYVPPVGPPEDEPEGVPLYMIALAITAIVIVGMYLFMRGKGEVNEPKQKQKKNAKVTKVTKGKRS